MSDCFHDLHFTQDALFIILVFNSVLVDDFDGDLLVSGRVDSLLHLAESALAEGLAQLVFTNCFGQWFLDLLSLEDSDFICKLILWLHLKDDKINNLDSRLFYYKFFCIFT